MNNLKHKIENIIANEGNTPFFSFGSFLFVISLLYGSSVKLREKFYKKGIFRSEKLPCTVISIGNITAGGTGKTPMAIYVAKLATRLGYKTAIVSRGYKGGAEKTGGVVSNGKTIYMSPDMAGDEPFMMASCLKDVPVVVGQNRFKAGMSAVKEFSPDIIVLDDAFQHLRVKRDIDLVLLDSSKPFGNNHLLPRGLLREPVSSLLRGDAYIMTRSDSAGQGSFSKVREIAQGKPVFSCFHVPFLSGIVKKNNSADLKQGYTVSQSEYNTEFLQGRRVVAFSGIAKNDDFRRTVDSFKCNQLNFMEFPDHYKYSDDDLQHILNSAKHAKADYILTTEKDYVRIAHRLSWPVDLAVIGIEISFGEDDFSMFIENRLKQKLET